jgi:hypothetical protein
MKSPTPIFVYCVDTSSLVNVQRTYSLAIFPGVSEALGELVSTGRLVAPREVFNELKRGGDDEIFQWAKDNKLMFRDPDAAQIQVARQIVNDPKFQGLFDVDSETPDADPYVIALASVEQGRGSLIQQQWVVVADESRAQPGKKPKIPDVCSDPRYQLECIKTLDMFRWEGWQFVKRRPGGRS